MQWRLEQLSCDFNPRPPHGGRRGQGEQTRRGIGISIHALLTEGDQCEFIGVYLNSRFQSTPSSRRATQYYYKKTIRKIFQSTPSSRRATVHTFKTRVI